MSSIYRKGRDGYFYYQTYIFNTNTGKKDKKIFHSLGTKDETLAKLKKIELDNRYEQKVFKNGRSIFNRLSNNKTILIASIILLFYVFKRIDKGKGNNNVVKNVVPVQINPKSKEDIKNIENKNIINETSADSNAKLDTKLIKDTSSLKEKASIQIPKYSIESIKRLSGAFDQGEIQISIVGEYNSESLLNLCNMIKDKHKEFSNLLICVYDSSGNGIKMAKNRGDDLTTKEIQKIWLAMYTYNSVEGVYFNDNPSGYLGAY